MTSTRYLVLQDWTFHLRTLLEKEAIVLRHSSGKVYNLVCTDTEYSENLAGTSEKILTGNKLPLFQLDALVIHQWLHVLLAISSSVLYTVFRNNSYWSQWEMCAPCYYTAVLELCLVMTMLILHTGSGAPTGGHLASYSISVIEIASIGFLTLCGLLMAVGFLIFNILWRNNK